MISPVLPECPACRARNNIQGKKYKGRFLRECSDCGNVWLPEVRRTNGRCVCGLKIEDCTGHTNLIQYDELMGTDRFYLRTGR